MKKLLLPALILCLLDGAALASGLLVPKDQSVPPLAIKYQRVDMRVTDGVAHARVEQVFKNSTGRDLEAVYVFPLPDGATVADFAMTINGKRMSGEVVEKGKARKIYQDIVRRMKDPGLLEHLGDNLFKVSVYPVPRNGEQKFELEYSQQLPYEAGLYKLTYPLRTAEKASQLLEDFTVAVRIKSSQPLKNIYSPSHNVGISRKGEHEAVIGFEEDRGVLSKDFVMYYGVSEKDFGLNLLTHATKGDDGYFMMMVAPSVTPKGAEILKKDVTFVFDTSGSMVGKKIEQARDALAYCVKKLNDGDRFNIISFSTDTELFRDKLVVANGENREAALEFVSEIEARGGTAIEAALKGALAMDFDRTRPNVVVFLTDGRPTIGETSTDVITKAVEQANARAGTRLFVFGVGEQVNTHLLDLISSQNGGVSRYVKPEEDIEVPVSSLADKMSHPVLARPVITIENLKTRKLHPRELPDLFTGDQLTLLGRYEGKGHVAIRLTGDVGGKKREFVYEATFPDKTAANDFIPRLWATRRVGYLLEEIRLQGTSTELEDEVKRLGKEHGIMTPYTSYLVLETEGDYKKHDIARGQTALNRPALPDPATEPRPMTPPRNAFAGRRFSMLGGSGTAANDAITAPQTRAPASTALPVFGNLDASIIAKTKEARPLEVRSEAERQAVVSSRMVRTRREDAEEAMAAESGAQAIKMSEAIQRYKRRNRVGNDVTGIKRVARKVFYLINGVWVDGDYKDGGKEIKVTFASDEYFKLLEEEPRLKDFFAVGEKLIVRLGDTTYIVE